MTRWAEDVRVDAPHPEYPRPQLERHDWLNLNGLWEYTVQPNPSAKPDAYDESILVPFPVESALSGVMQRVDGHDLWYRRDFRVPEGWSDQRLLLHFGAVNWDTTVWLNGHEIGHHRGGYNPFSFELTEFLSDEAEQELIVRVWNPVDQGTQPRGKQVTNPEGIWYTPSTGIWQTVWLEPVPHAYIDGLTLTPDIDADTLHVTVQGQGTSATQRVRAVASEDGDVVGEVLGAVGEMLELTLPDPILWSPDTPFLYDLKVQLLEDDVILDEVESYFGMREISLGTDEQGVPRLFLNNEPLFHYGTLDQGFWPDGLYTAPTDEALRYDLEVTKALGFNMVRKHVKVEPARWYYWADKLGLLVWQDMPNGDAHAAYGEGEIVRSQASAAQFELELERMIDAVYNHPSIVMWVIFNEGWGQYDTARLTDWLHAHDPTRLVNSASGWNDMGTGDVLDIHSYPGPDAPSPTDGRAAVLGEFGGLGLPLSGHTWQDESNWGYRSFADVDSLNDAYLDLLSQVRRLIGSSGLAAAVYTQTTDVETEVNGLMSYDREVIKFDEARLNEAHADLYRPPPLQLALVPSSQEEGQLWRYTTDDPGDDWAGLEFDDSAWQEGPGGFGTPDVPNAAVRTEWRTSEIWLRYTFDLDHDPQQLQDLRLLSHHNEDMAIYLNGQHIVTLPYYTFDYVTVRRDEAVRAALRPGHNVIAIHGKHSWGGQYMDVGLKALLEPTGPR